MIEQERKSPEAGEREQSLAVAGLLINHLCHNKSEIIAYKETIAGPAIILLSGEQATLKADKLSA